MKTTLTALALAAMLATSAQAGGPVIVEDETAEAAPQNRKNVIPLILLGIAVAALIAGGSDNCFVEETPAPTPPSGGC